MTVDARCLIATDLGIVKDGSGLSEDHAQGLGLITYRGTWIFDGILTPARGRVIQVAYARPQYGASGLLTRFYPRLQVISSSADPFANETTVEVGCQLTLMRERKDAVQYRAIDHPPAWWSALSPERRREVPPVIEVQGVIEFCLDALGIPLAAGSATTADVKVVEAIDLSGGYVQVLDDMLKSSLLIGHITPAGELLVQPVDLTPAPGPVLRRQNLLTLRPINDRGGAEQVVVEFDAIEAPGNLVPEQLTEEQRQMRDWELDVVIGPPETHTLVYYGVTTTTGPGGSNYEVNYDARFTREYQTIQSSYTRTNYKTFTWTDQEGKPQSSDLAVEKTRTVLVTGSPGYGRGDQFYYPNTGSAPAGSQETTISQYEITADGPRLVREETFTRQESRGYTSILPTYYLPEGSLALSTETTTSRTVVDNEVNEESGLTKRTTTRYTAVAKTQAGSQAMFHLFDRINSRPQYDQAVEAGKTETMVSVEVQIGIGRQFGLQSRPSAQSRLRESQLSRFRDSAAGISSGTVGSSIGQEEPQIVTSGYRFGDGGTDVWNTSRLRLPYAPDDFITASGTVDLLLTRGRARERALEYGRIQNALDFGHANGVEITTAPWELPSPPLAAVYIEESGVSTAFRVNGRSWEIRNGAMIVTADLCLVGNAGRIIGETPVNWTPQPADPADLPGLGAPSGSGELLPANTITLPGGFDATAPGSVWSGLPDDGADTYGPSRSPSSIAPPYVQTVQILARSRSVAITTELLYSTAPITEQIEAVSRSKAEVREVSIVALPVAEFVLTPQAPFVYAPTLVSVPRPAFRLTPQAPTVTGAAFVGAPRARFRLTPQVPVVGVQGRVDAPLPTFRLTPQVPTVSGALDPSTLSPLAWWDASDATTITTSGGLITDWEDKSGNGWDLAQGEPTQQPIYASAAVNGLNAAQWPSSNNNDFLQSASGTFTAAEYYSVVVFDRFQFANYEGLLNGAGGASSESWFTGGQDEDGLSTSANTHYINGDTGTNRYTDMFPELQDGCLVRSFRSSGDMTTDNGVVMGMDRNLSGLNRGWKGYICEVVAFSTALSSGDRAALENHLMAKWGIT